MSQLFSILPEIVMLSMICLVLLIDVFIQQPLRTVTYFFSQLTLLAVMVLCFLQLNQPSIISFDNNFIRDNLSSLIKLLIAVATFVSFIFSRDYNTERELQKGEYYILILLSVLGMMVLVSGFSMLTLYLGLELVSLPLYALVAMRRESIIATEAGIKYFILGALASGLLLYGMSIIYGLTGSIDIATVAAKISTASSSELILLVFSLIFIIVGVAFKFGAAPFHVWAPDVYEGAPTSIVLFIASASKLAAFVMAVRLLIDMLPALQAQWQSLLIFIAVLSMAFGNLIAIAQQNLKRLLAYSAIAQIGYMLLGLLTGTAEGYSAAMFYIISYALMALGALSLLIILSSKNFECEKIEDLRGLNSRNPWLAFLMLLIIFSLAGIPPSVGFFAKMSVLEALISVHLVWLAAVAMIFAVIGSYYYLRIVKVMYFEQPTIYHTVEWRVGTQVTFSITGMLLLGLGLFPGALFNLCHSMF